MDKTYFDQFRTGDYQRVNFDNFLSHIHFSYSVPSIHVTGTNGKGSTCVYLASMYTSNGYKTGLFISPFLNEPNEMISINGKAISDEDFLRIIEEHKKDIDKYQLSAFEVQTFVAFTYFIENNCDIAVIECGLGGETDATNVFDGILSIITSVSLEHTDALGYSISEITQQKAGIIKEGKPILIGDLPKDAVTVVVKKAKETNSEIYYLGHYVNKMFHDDGYTFDYGEIKGVKIKSLADYSVDDACLALEGLFSLKEKFPYQEDKVKEGLANAFVPCRLEVVSKQPLVIIDGGHNPEAIDRLCQRPLKNITSNKPIHIIFACFRDKNMGNMLNSLGAITNDLTLTTFDHPRARKEEEFFLFLGDYTFRENALELIKEKLAMYPDEAFLITGSLAFAAVVRKWFKEGLIK